MLPGRIQGANKVFGAPPDWDSVSPLPCSALAVKAEITGEGLPCLSSAWLPTPEELAALQAGGAVLLFIFSTAHPVVAVGVSAPADDLAASGSPAERQG